MKTLNVKKRANWSTKFLPIIAGALLISFLAVVVLPSTLRHQKVQTTETPEYAPVTSDDNQGSGQGGNVSSFGLRSGRGILGEGPAAEPGASGGGIVLGKNQSTKKCVGNPPRQTEDRLSPPCVAFFGGDNFGTTYQGVTKEEIQVLYYLEGSTYNNNNVESPQSPVDTYFDLGKPPTPNEYFVLKYLRGWQKFFNDRFQTYGRTAHFHVYFANRSLTTPEKRRQDAEDNFSRIKPFAVVSSISRNGSAYLKAMAQKGVIGFTSNRGISAEQFRSFPGLQWGYRPSIEEQANLFADFVCRKVVPYPTSFSGNLLENSKPRRLGLLYSTDPTRLELGPLKDAIKAAIDGCGGAFVDEQTFPNAYCTETCNNNNAGFAMASFREKGVTTVIWPGGYETTNTQAASAISYRPEWILAGDGTQEGNSAGKYQEPSEWANAWIVTSVTKVTQYEEETCYLAYKDVDPDEASFINIKLHACGFYDSTRQLFTGIQVAGPRVSPAAIDKGFHAIPAIASTDPKTPACFYRPSDYTCIKDSIAEWWDSSGPDPTTRENTPGPGCWRLTHSGKRYLSQAWPDGDVLNLRNRNEDGCNGYQ